MPSYHLISPDTRSTVTVKDGELVSYRKHGEELMHPSTAPGWSHTDIEMFPLIGPSAANDYLIHTPQGDATQDQHGMRRELSYHCVQEHQQTLLCHKSYTQNTKIPNSKYPHRSSKKLLTRPYSIDMNKTFSLSDDVLRISFEIIAPVGMPYMFGYHPAFKINTNDQVYCEIHENTNKKNISIQKIADTGDNALPLFGQTVINLIKSSGSNIRIQTQGFGNIMLRSPTPNLLCIEPITHYPDLQTQKYDETNMRRCTGQDLFDITLTPFNQLKSPI